MGYFEASVITCCLKFWFREIGFSISYGALLLKTWRYVYMIFMISSFIACCIVYMCTLKVKVPLDDDLYAGKQQIMQKL